MYYIAKLIKKRGLFQKPYFIKDNYIYIQNTKRGKRAFLKSGIKKVVFTESFKSDDIIGTRLVPMSQYDKNFVLTYLEDMVKAITEFLKIELPVGEIAVFLKNGGEMISVLKKYGKIITLVGEEAGGEVIDGIMIRGVRKLKRKPDLYITDGQKIFPSPYNAPVIALGEMENITKNTLSYKSIAFRTPLLPFETDADTIMYLKKCEGDIAYEVTSFRKKTPPLFIMVDV